MGPRMSGSGITTRPSASRPVLFVNPSFAPSQHTNTEDNRSSVFSSLAPIYVLTETAEMAVQPSIPLSITTEKDLSVTSRRASLTNLRQASGLPKRKSLTTACFYLPHGDDERIPSASVSNVQPSVLESNDQEDE